MGRDIHGVEINDKLRWFLADRILVTIKLLLWLSSSVCLFVRHGCTVAKRYEIRLRFLL